VEKALKNHYLDGTPKQWNRFIMDHRAGPSIYVDKLRSLESHGLPINPSNVDLATPTPIPMNPQNLEKSSVWNAQMGFDRLFCPQHNIEKAKRDPANQAMPRSDST
jgi:hypothetical protein